MPKAEKSSSDYNEKDLHVMLGKIRITALPDDSKTSNKIEELSSTSKSDLPPGSPRSVPTSVRKCEVEDAELALKLAFGGLSSNPFQTLQEQPKAAADVIMKAFYS